MLGADVAFLLSPTIRDLRLRFEFEIKVELCCVSPSPLPHPPDTGITIDSFPCMGLLMGRKRVLRFPKDLEEICPGFPGSGLINLLLRMEDVLYLGMISSFYCTKEWSSVQILSWRLASYERNKRKSPALQRSQTTSFYGVLMKFYSASRAKMLPFNVLRACVGEWALSHRAFFINLFPALVRPNTPKAPCLTWRMLPTLYILWIPMTSFTDALLHLSTFYQYYFIPRVRLCKYKALAEPNELFVGFFERGITMSICINVEMIIQL